MSVFPACSSILSPSQLGIWVQEQYELGSDTTCQVIKTGVNHSYLIVDDAKRYVLRVYAFGWRTKQEISEELRLLRHLKDHGCSVSCGMADTAGCYIQEIEAAEGVRHAVLFEYAEGRKVMDASAAQHHSIGAQIAQMHQCMKDLVLERTDYNTEVILRKSWQQLQSFMEPGATETELMSTTLQFLLNEWEQVDTSAVTSGAVHLDMWFDNMVMDGAAQITVFDFDFCGNGWLCLDLAYYLMQLHALTPDEARYREKADSFLAGYQTIRTVSAEELRIIPMLGVSLYFFYLGIQCRRFDDWANGFLNEVYLKRYIEVRVKRYFDYCFGIRGSVS